MYNSIYPININYSKHSQYAKANNNGSGANNSSNLNVDVNQQNQNTFPNGTKVAIDYSKGQINISQVLTDFRSTIIAINAPEPVKDEVYTYLSLVEKESLKENPSRDIIVANLKNASRISDAYIASALNKQSDVVEKWIDTLFLQKINLKADPNEINPDFQLEFPKNAQERIDAQKNIEKEQIVQTSSFEVNDAKEPNPEVVQQEIKITDASDNLNQQTEYVEEQQVVLEHDFELSEQNEDINNDDVSKTQTPFSPLCVADEQARALFAKAKSLPQTNKGDIEALNLLNDALGIVAGDENANKNIRAAIHIERGKIFDNYDYVDYALRDYFEATKADDCNLKAQAFYKSAQIYDEFSEFYPALDNYLASVAYSGEAENIQAQTKVLSSVASLYARQYDTKNALQYSDLAIDAALNSEDESLIANTYSIDAQNSQQLGENDRAINSYKNALSIFSQNDESYEQMAYNYEQAAIVMRRLGNFAKAAKLQSKADQYRQKAQLAQAPLGVAS